MIPSSLLTFSTKAKLPTATASDHRPSRTTTHLGERSLPVGDELAETPLVSKSRITPIVPVSRNTLRWFDFMSWIRTYQNVPFSLPICLLHRA